MSEGVMLPAPSPHRLWIPGHRNRQPGGWVWAPGIGDTGVTPYDQQMTRKWILRVFSPESPCKSCDAPRIMGQLWVLKKLILIRQTCQERVGLVSSPTNAWLSVIVGGRDYHLKMSINGIILQQPKLEAVFWPELLTVCVQLPCFALVFFK
jgi:hypothetical protein